jgi:ferric-dicitrate binding protein FerR (iron transport regulator)
MVAALAVLAVGLHAMLPFDRARDPLGTIARVEGKGIHAVTPLLPTRELAVGATLKVGGRWQSAGTVLVVLIAGGSVRVAPGSTFSADSEAEITLLAGRMYFDFPAGARPLTLRTSAGVIQHLGTQFEVLASDDRLRVRVREGIVRVRQERRVETVEQGAELLLVGTQPPARRSIPTYGPEWAWVESIAADFDIDNRPLNEFLEWVGRETGRRVTFSDTQTRDVAIRTRLHGSVRGMRPLEALDFVLSTTSLRYEIRDDVIRVSFRNQ